MVNERPLELDWLKRWALYSPEATALKDADSGQGVSYSDFYKKSCLIASWLESEFAVGPGDRVAAIGQNTMEMIFLFFAVQRLGAVFVPVNFRLAAPEIRHILQDAGPRVLFAQEEFLESATKAAEGSEFPLLDLRRADMAAGGAFVPRAYYEGAKMTDPCLILYTSGSTGTPKGALLTHKMIFWNSVSTGLRLNLVQSDVTITTMPLFHTGGWNVLTLPLIHRGGKVILSRKFSPGKTFELIKDEKVSIYLAVPTMMDMLARDPGFAGADFSSVRFAIVGGEPMPIPLIKAWSEKGVAVRQGYGLTEFGPNVFSLNEQDAVRKMGSIGYPNFYVDVKISGDDGQDVAPGEVGELLLGGPMVMVGYWNNPKATADAFRDGWLLTGDLVRRDEEGFFYVVGRKKDMFISGGENVYPAEVEKLLLTRAEVREAAVVGVPDPRWGEVGKAFIVLKNGCTADADEFKNYCLLRLAKYKIPKFFTFVPELPKGDTGKINKRALQQRHGEDHQS